MTFEQAAMREFARNVGRENPEREWISTPLDSWERNPFYTGEPGRHPEDDSFWDEAEAAAQAHPANAAEGDTPPEAALPWSEDEFPF